MAWGGALDAEQDARRRDRKRYSPVEAPGAFKRSHPGIEKRSGESRVARCAGL